MQLTKTPNYLSALFAAVMLVQCVCGFAELPKARPMFRGPSSEKVVALTFDDGPDPRFTPRILATLQKFGVHATFFVVGENAEKYPELVKKELAEGNTLGNHTYTHPEMNHVSTEQAHLELSKCNATLERIVGIGPRLFRPPKGFYDTKTMEMLAEMGYQPVMWSLAVEHHEAPTPELMVQRVMEKVQPGMIILCHDGRLNRENTVLALPGIIAGLKARGYTFITVDEMLEIARKARELNKDIHSPKTQASAHSDDFSLLMKLFHLHI